MNTSRPAKGRYKGEEALVLESDALRATVLPQRGSKLASLVYKPLEAELLWQNPGEVYRSSSYADLYESGEASGFDEMFPTISRCFYEREPWAGVEMPDHGEVWSIPWRHRLEEDGVVMNVEGVRFPYRLEKAVSLCGDVLRLDYTAENPHTADFECIWAAHPLFNATAGMKLAVPQDLRRIVNAVPSRRLGAYGRIYRFPNAELEDGSLFDLSTIPAKGGSDYQKYWFLGRLTEGWCILHEPAARLNIGLAWPAGQVPYLGLWVNEGGWFGQYNVAPEPATGAMDRVDFSRMWGMGGVLPAGQARQWWLTITVRQGSEPRGGPL